MRANSKYGVLSKKEADRAFHVKSVQELSQLYDERNNQIYVSRAKRKNSTHSQDSDKYNTYADKPEKYSDYNGPEREKQLQKMDRLEKVILRR